MRLLAVEPGPAFSVQDVHNGLVKGLRANGVNVATLNLSDYIDFYGRVAIKKGNRWRQCFDEVGTLTLASEHIAAACWKFDPDVVIMTMGTWVVPDIWKLFRARRHHLVAWFTESPYEDDRQLLQAPWADTVVINDPTNLERFQAVNPRTVYAPHSFDPDLHRPGAGRPEWRCDVAFVGTGFQSRIDLMEAVNWSGIDLRVGGMWQGLEDDSPLLPYLLRERDTCMDNDETVALYQSCRASFNAYRREANRPDLSAGWAMGPREVELAATGTFFLRDPRPEGDEVFPMLPTFADAGDLGDQLRWWLAHDDERAEAARQARGAVADRTFEATAGRLLRLVESARQAA